MMKPLSLLRVVLTGAVVLAAPLKRVNTITAADLIAIESSTSSCDGAPFSSECRTAAQAAPMIASSFTNFGLTSFGEQAAVVALMLYESGDFKYAINHYPGVPGQGTRNMQSSTYNSKYAEYLSTICQDCGITTAQVQQASSAGPAQLLDLVNTDQWSFSSAAWFLSTQCDASIGQGLAAESEEGWESYLSECVGTTATADRTAIWTQAMALKAW